MTESRAPDLLRHIVEAAELACSYVAGLSKDEFLGDTRTQQAVIMNIVIIGEAATRLAKDDPDFVERYPDIPWKSMRGMRNRIAHGYFDVDLEIVWETVRKALPGLIEQIRSIQ